MSLLFRQLAYHAVTGGDVSHRDRLDTGGFHDGFDWLSSGGRLSGRTVAELARLAAADLRWPYTGEEVVLS